MSVLFLNINFKGNDKLSSAIEKISKSSEKLQSRFDVLKKKQDELSKFQFKNDRFIRLKTDVEQAGRSLENNRKKIAALQQQMANGGGKELAKQLKQAQNETAKLENTVAKGKQQLLAYRQELNQAGHKGKSFGDVQRQIAQDMDKTTSAMKKQQEHLERIGKAQSRFDAAKARSGKLAMAAGVSYAAAQKVADGLAIPVKVAIDAESAMADVAKVVDGLKIDGKITDEYKRFEKDMIAMSSRLGRSFEDVAAIISGGAQGGIAKSELLAFGEHATKTAVAWGMEAGQVGQAVAELRASLKLSQKEVQTLADQINYLGNNSTNNAAFILEVVQRVGSVGAAAGVSGDLIAALGASISGVDASTVGTGLKNIIKSLTKGESATMSQKKAWQALGTTAEQMAVEMLADPEKAIKKYIDMLGKLPEEQRLAFASMLSGDEALPVLSQLMNNPETLNKFSSDVKNKGKIDGSVDAEYNSATATSGFKIDKAKNDIKLLSQQFGATLLPIVGDVAAKISEIIKKTQAWAAKNPKVFDYLAKGAAVLGVILSGVAAIAGLASVVILPFAWLNLALVKSMGSVLNFASSFAKLAQMAKGIFSVVRIFGVLKSAIFGIGQVFARVGMMLLANPILALIAAIAVAGFLIYKNWDTIKPYLLNFWENVKIKWQAFKSWLASLWQGVKDGVVGKFEEIKAAILAKFEAIKAGISAKWEAIKAGISAKWEAIKAEITAKLVYIYIVITAKLQAVWAYMVSIWERIKQTVRAAWNNLVSVFRNNAILSAIMGAFNSVFGYLSGLGGRLRSIGVNIIDGLVGGIRSGFNKLKGVWNEINSYLPSFSKKSLDIHSPSRVMRRIGGFVTDGLTVGISKRFIPLKKTYDGMMNYLSRPQINAGKFLANADKVGAAVGSDNVIADAVRLVSPNLGKGILASLALDNLPNLLGSVVKMGGETAPKPANISPVKSTSAMMASAMTSSQNTSQNTSYTINIQAPAGADERTLIQKLRTEIERIEQQKAARHRARLTD